MLDLAKKIFVSKDDECDAAFPKRRSAKVTVTLADGRAFDFYAPTRKGDPDAPLSDTELSAKYHDLATDIIGAERTQQLEACIWKLDTLDDVAALYPGLRNAAE